MRDHSLPFPDDCWRAALDDWTLRPPSRRLRKLYRALAMIEAAREAVCRSNLCPEHAPTACQIRRRQLATLDDELYDLYARIARLQNE